MRRGGKAKTRKAVAKRFKVTGSGKILRRRKGNRHLAASKNRKRKRRLSSATLAAETVTPMLKECMPFDH